jgi:hypothetical protein
MSWRRNELAAFRPEVTWLADADALTAFRRAWDCSSSTRYGLNDEAFPSIDHLDVSDPGPETREWLARRIGDGDDRLLLIFGKDEVCAVRAAFFLDCWQDVFCPSRDDAFILPEGGGWALFYCHEDEFEFAIGRPAEPT